MTRRRKIGVMGAGSIGCYVGGKLLAADAADVVLIGRPRVRDEIAEHGLLASGLEQPGTRVPPDRVAFETDAAALADCDAVLCCVKSLQTAEAADEMAGVLADGAVVFSFQNGLRNAPTLCEHLPGRRVVPTVVGFNVVSRGGGVFHRGMSGPLQLERCEKPVARDVADALSRAGLDVEERDDLAPDQWTKLLVNLNNAVSALTGAPTRELLLSPDHRRVIAGIVEEAVGVLRTAGIRPAKLRGVPIAWMPKVLRLPTPLVRLVTRAQMKVDPQARSSMWEDLEKGRPTEVDYLNGEIVRLAERVGAKAPLNRAIVELVRAAEQDGPGSPELSASELWGRLNRRRDG